MLLLRTVTLTLLVSLFVAAYSMVFAKTTLESQLTHKLIQIKG